MTQKFEKKSKHDKKGQKLESKKGKKPLLKRETKEPEQDKEEDFY